MRTTDDMSDKIFDQKCRSEDGDHPQEKNQMTARCGSPASVAADAKTDRHSINNGNSTFCFVLRESYFCMARCNKAYDCRLRE